MGLVCLEYSRSSSSPLQSVASPETSTPAAAKHKKRGGRKTRHPVYRGVRRKNGGKWVCEVRDPNKKSRLIWLGTFPTSETAAVAHDVAVLALRGESAELNFPESVACLPRPHSSSHHDIRRAAAQAAREFCPAQSRLLSHVKKVIMKSSNSNSNSNTNLLGQNNDEEDPRGCCQAEFVCNRSCNQSPTSKFVDEEAVFNMPVLLDSMAEGMLLTPLAMKKGFNWSQYEDEGTEFSLWGK